MKIVKRVSELPNQYTIPNSCPICEKPLWCDSASTLKWVVDGNDAHGVCSTRCARQFIQEHEGKK